MELMEDADLVSFGCSAVLSVRTQMLTFKSHQIHKILSEFRTRINMDAVGRLGKM